MSNKVFEGEIKNVADGDIFDITVTSVDSVPCIDPYCDAIIAVEKAELRVGLCGVCFKSEAEKIRRKSIQYYFPVFFVGAGFGLAYAAQAIYSLITNSHEILLDGEPKAWVFYTGMIIMAPVIFAVSVINSRHKDKYDLRKKSKNKSNNEQSKE